jgi:ADP-dependent NAD(P)H-hydrate dehydratase / NAD(P)H-hydrate epimerase
MLLAGVKASREIEPRMRAATLLVDALLGTGLSGPARGRALEWIREMNTGFPGGAHRQHRHALRLARGG